MKGKCYICKKLTQTEEHHIFEGKANRKLSEKYNLKVDLCQECHRTGKNAVHKCGENYNKLHRAGQKAFERVYGHNEFMKIFKKNYL